MSGSTAASENIKEDKAENRVEEYRVVKPCVAQEPVTGTGQQRIIRPRGDVSGHQLFSLAVLQPRSITGGRTLSIKSMTAKSAETGKSGRADPRHREPDRPRRKNMISPENVL
jgi:hypothetical protein